jgi:hypothetical protein
MDKIEVDIIIEVFNGIASLLLDPKKSQRLS